MSRITLAGLNRIAEDHNKHNSGEEWTWEDVIFHECLCGNNVKNDIDRMSKKETLTVLDWAARYRFGDDVCLGDQRIFEKNLRCCEGQSDGKAVVIMERVKLYAVPYNHGTLLYRDKECTKFYADDPWYRHRKSKFYCYDGYWYHIIVLNIKKDPKVELEKFRNKPIKQYKSYERVQVQC